MTGPGFYRRLTANEIARQFPQAFIPTSVGTRYIL